MSAKVKLRYLGTDYWGRAVFKTIGKGIHCKTCDVFDAPCGFLNADNETKERIISDLHTCEPLDDPEGDPGWPLKHGMFDVLMESDCLAENLNSP